MVRANAKTPWRTGAPGGLRQNSLTMTYFHTGCSTIIGAKSFHGPVRDGKGWDRLAMVVRHDGEPLDASSGAIGKKRRLMVFSLGVMVSARVSLYSLDQGYRDKPHGQLVLVSSTHYCASTPSLFTSWSRTTL
jgi:hypothetical protein